MATEKVPEDSTYITRLGQDGSEAPAGDSLATRLQRRYGRRVDPQISLDSTPPGPGEREGGELKRLETDDLKTRYTLRGEVARGGMGAILRVWDENLRRDLAMKVVLSTKSENAGSEGSTPVDARMLGRFLEEAQVTGQLDHPGIVPVHELGMDEKGGVYFTMRLVKGRDLKYIFDLVRERKEGWSLTRALGVLLKMCEAMAYAHDKGVIHRDLKPANIMVGRFGEVYVMDWGLARVLGKPDSSAPAEPDDADVPDIQRRTEKSTDLNTLDGDIVGTPAYMSPEQAFGRISKLDARTDVYAAGAMIYHVLTGRAPYTPLEGKASAVEILIGVREGPPTPLAELAPNVPAEVAAICEKAMERDQTGRYADMQELAEDLRAYLEGRVVRAYEAGAIAELRKWIRRNRGLAFSSAAAVLMLVIGLATSSTLFVRAERNAKLAESRRTKVLRLSDVKRLEMQNAEAASLWPAHPEMEERYDGWLLRARALADRLPEHEQALADLRARALAPTPEEIEGDRVTHPRFAELEALEKHYEMHADDHPESARVNAEYSEDELDEHLAEDRARLAELRDAVAERQTWSFTSPEEEWQHDVLTDLVSALAEFADGERGVIPDVEARLAFAGTVVERTLEGEDAVARWAEAIASVADPAECPAYGGLELSPQIGLLPLGRDPRSGLWEFAHVQSGEVPERDEGGELLISEDSCIVLVLLPGGSFLMGAQPGSEDLPNFDKEARANEVPVHEIDIGPFFLSKYEMTQGQWLRFTGANPANYGPATEFLGRQHNLLHPVEQVSHDGCETVLGNMDLSLPTEAQWEYGARAGTSTPWPTGEDRESLIGAVNLADRAGTRAGAKWAAIADWPDLDDGSAVHAPVGSYRPNAFGLCEITGNVAEWCADGFDNYGTAAEEGTGRRLIEGKPRYYVYRGGSFLTDAKAVRSAARDGNAAAYTGSSVGVRPARRLDG